MQTIDIRTTQNVTIEYEPASVRERIIAFMIDAVIVGAIYTLLFLILLSTLKSYIFESSIVLYVIYGLLPIGTLILYQLLSEVLADGQSWGKKTMGIKVVRLDGQEPGLTDYLLRAVFHIVDSILSFGILAVLLISSSAKGQRLGDMTANTTVIRIRQNLHFQLDDILRINSLEDYHPHYPEVRRLSEQDMLLIKSAISRYRTYRNDAHQEVLDELVKQLTVQLDIAEPTGNKIEFLKTLIRDYIVLTR
jgi:uncharacterized RDD family membrane protein YckC